MKKRRQHAESTEVEPQDESESEAAEKSEAKGTAPDSELDRVARERDEYLASWQRAAADYQNLRRRLQEDVDAGVALKKRSLLTELLLVLDYLDMALSTPVKSEEGKQLHAGVEATRDALLGALERAGVRAVPEGGRFDPALHEAVARAEPEEGEAKWTPGEIVETLRRGYTLDGKMLRPSQVKVAGGLEEAFAARGEGSSTDERRRVEKPETD